MRGVRTAVSRRRAPAVVAAVVVLGLSAVPVAAAITSGTYKGQTSQTDPVQAVISGSLVKKFSITWRAHCQISNSKLEPLQTFQYKVKLGRHGWTATGKYRAPSGNGYTEKFTVKDHATFTGTRIHGTFTGTVQVYQDSNSQHVDTCSSGKISFNLRRS